MELELGLLIGFYTQVAPTEPLVVGCEAGWAAPIADAFSGEFWIVAPRPLSSARLFSGLKAFESGSSDAIVVLHA